VGEPINVTSPSEPFFTLKAITSGDPIRFDMLKMIAQHLERIGIEVNVHFLEWPMFLAEVVNYHNYDLNFGVIGGGSKDPDYSLIYSENSILNFFGYNSSMDWDEELGMGKHEWYLQHGKTIMPPHSAERVQHYWDWQHYFMDEILPLKPTLLHKSYTATWSNLEGYEDIRELKENWGKLSWDGMHLGQKSTSEFVVAVDEWIQLNPIYEISKSTGGIPEYILDGLITYDYEDQTYYPHLAYDWTMENYTHFRVNLRQGIRWHDDPDGLFSNEYFDADDVIFSYYVWKNLSDFKSTLYFIEDVKKVDQYTVDFFIDTDPFTPENEPFAPFLYVLAANILPEHYLNQTQLADGKTPDVTHQSWITYSTSCFGTSLFEIDDFLEIETTLQLYADSWWLDPAVDKTNMNFENRFGDFTGELTSLRIRRIPDPEMRIAEFQLGRLDKVPLPYLDIRNSFEENPDIDVYGRVLNSIEHMGYNMREDRPVIGSREPAPGNSSITKGLAVRKAIAYAVNRDEINQILCAGESLMQDHPICNVLGKWCNPNIIRYNFNLDKAKEYMRIAGYGEEQITPSGWSNWEIAGIVISSVVVAGAVSFVIFWLYRRSK
jgi:ABC-type transport system substrate-binding protein